MPTRKRDSLSSASSSSSEHTALNKDGSQRKSRVLSRKTDHSIIERRRREKMNEKLVTLQNLVPACQLECRNLINRKVQPTEPACKPDHIAATERRLCERLERKMETTMILEKLCIMSHTLDYVQRLQQENQLLKRKTERCSPCTSPETPVTSEVSAKQVQHDTLHDCTDDGRDPDTHSQSMCCKKRRLHWGSNDVRRASIRGEVAETQLNTPETQLNTPEPDRLRAHSTASASESLFRSSCHPITPCTSSQPRYSCAQHSNCRTHRASTQSNSPVSSPRYYAASYHRLASIYRTPARGSSHRPLPPLSLYTSTATAQT